MYRLGKNGNAETQRPRRAGAEFRVSEGRGGGEGRSVESSVRAEDCCQGTKDAGVVLGDVTGQGVPPRTTAPCREEGKGSRLGYQVSRGYYFPREKRGHLNYAVVVGGHHIERT